MTEPEIRDYLVDIARCALDAQIALGSDSKEVTRCVFDMEQMTRKVCEELLDDESREWVRMERTP